MDSLKLWTMATFILLMWGLALALGIFALWATFWVVLFVVVLFRVAHQDLAYRRAEEKKLMISGAKLCKPLSTKENDKQVPTALLLHGLLLQTHSVKLSFSILP